MRFLILPIIQRLKPLANRSPQGFDINFSMNFGKRLDFRKPSSK